MEHYNHDVAIIPQQHNPQCNALQPPYINADCLMSHDTQQTDYNGHYNYVNCLTMMYFEED